MAWFMTRGGGTYDLHPGDRKRRLLSELEGVLVEIGSGTGPNLRYLPSEVVVIGVEPNPFMHPHFLQESQARNGRSYLIRGSA